MVLMPASAPSVERYARIETPFGELLACADEMKRLVGLRFTGGRRAPAIPPGAVCDEDAFEQLRDQLDVYFAGEPMSFDLRIALAGPPFQRRVWRALQAIPYGATCSYGEIAARIDHPRAARAVGYANACNPLALVVPCHRVIGARGELTGYAGGLERKQSLLRHEATSIRRHISS